MNDNQRKINVKIDKFRKIYEHTQGGIFSNATREKLLTKEGISRRGQSVNTFWYRQRENVKTALIDLQLFIETANRENVNNVINEETLHPIVSTLFWDKAPDTTEVPDSTSAKIAHLFIFRGFEYFRMMNTNYLTSAQNKIIDDAMELSHQLRYLMTKEYSHY